MQQFCMYLGLGVKYISPRIYITTIKERTNEKQSNDRILRSNRNKSSRCEIKLYRPITNLRFLSKVSNLTPPFVLGVALAITHIHNNNVNKQRYREQRFEKTKEYSIEYSVKRRISIFHENHFRCLKNTSII